MNTLIAVASTVKAPSVEWNTLIPYFVLAGGAIVTLFASLIAGRTAQRGLVPLLAVATLIASGVFFAIGLHDLDANVLSGALRVDDLARVFSLLFIASALVSIVLAWRSPTLQDFGRGEFYSLLITVVLGMALLASAQNLVTVFLALELFSIPLYVLCAADLRREGSLESGIKYLIIGSLGSATLLYGLALTYGATGSTDFAAINVALSSAKIGDDALLLVGVALTFVGLAFKASIAPFHQWTPDVYEGAPTPVTAFMAVATKAATFALILRYTGQAILPIVDHWQPVLAALAVVTIVVGNLGAMGQKSLKRLLGYSGVAQAGYLLVGVVVSSALGARATVFYMLVYLFMNVAPFAVITARERAGAGEGFDGLRGLGREAPALAWSMTISMIALSGLPITAGFIGKLFLIEAAVDGDYAWLAVVIVLGSAMSLVYYLRVVAAMWMGADATASSVASGDAVLAGASPEADSSKHPELVAIAVLAAAGSVVFGVWPGPLLDLARDAAISFLQLVA
ncbi:MAG: NADH-quinone oxidoreductase subunit N [Thermoleophilaceae bacterium]|nr:NADH-quinone oxidoreductase subunit N [Thermoleophilaceae bacterium]